MIAGRDHRAGEAKNSWRPERLWNYVAATQWILGIRPGLTVFKSRGLPPHGRFRSRAFPGRNLSLASNAGPGNAVALEVDANVRRHAHPLPPKDKHLVNVIAR